MLHHFPDRVEDYTRNVSEYENKPVNGNEEGKEEDNSEESDDEELP